MTQHELASRFLLKAVLAKSGIDVRKTHNLIYLMDQVADCGLSYPADLRALQSLNPYAVEYRYDLLDEEGLPRLSPP